MSVMIHDSAIVEPGVVIGDGTCVWDNAHLRSGAVVGRHSIIGGKSYHAAEVRIGDHVKINTEVYLCSGVTVEDGVMVSAHVVFTNDRFPRATTPDLSELRTSAIDEHTERTTVREGATIGAGARIGPGLTIGRFAMVGMGAVVTRDVPDFHLVVGSPAASTGVVCRCGPPLLRFPAGEVPTEQRLLSCAACGRRYLLDDATVLECHD